MKQGDEVRVKKQQVKQTVDHLKRNGIKPLSTGKVISVMKENDSGDTYYMIEFVVYDNYLYDRRTISLPEDAIEDIFSGLFDSDNPFGDLFGDIFKGKGK